MVTDPEVARDFCNQHSAGHDARLRVFVCLDYYLPGYRAGGPPRTLWNMVERLSNRIDFWIFTRAHDFRDHTPYPNIRINDWNEVGRAHVFYCPAKHISFSVLRRLIAATRPQIIYLNSFFSPLSIRCLVLRRCGLLPKLPFVVAPRGEFSPKALRQKWLKKRTYRIVAHIAGLYRDVQWQASSSAERDDIVRAGGTRVRVSIAPNIAAAPPATGEYSRPPKRPGNVRLVFFSRISPLKNLQYALARLRDVAGEIVFDIYGPKETERYWQICASAMRRLPGNVRSIYRGPLQPAEVPEVLSRYHFLLLPTLGENFGHAILEAFSVGCPVITSDRTPWRDLEQSNAGWDLGLDDPARWLDVLARCVEMDQPTYTAHSAAAIELARSFSLDQGIEAQNLALFENVIAAG